MIRPIYVFSICVLVQCSWAALVLFDPSAANATPLSGPFGFFGERQLTTGLMLLTANVLAVVAILNPPSVPTFFLVAPQLVFVWAAAAASGVAIVEQHYADGVIRPFAFIAADQNIQIAFAVMYTIGIIQHFENGRHKHD